MKSLYEVYLGNKNFNEHDFAGLYHDACSHDMQYQLVTAVHYAMLSESGVCRNLDFRGSIMIL